MSNPTNEENVRDLYNSTMSTTKVPALQQLKEAEKSYRYFSYTLAILILLFTVFLYHQSSSINAQAKENSITIQKNIDRMNYQIELYKVTKNENYLILLHSDLSETSTLLKQTQKLSNSFYTFYKKPDCKLFCETIDLQLFYLEETLSKNIVFNEKDIFHFGSVLGQLSRELEKEPTTSFEDFSMLTNNKLQSIYAN